MRFRRLFWPLASSIVLVALLFLFVFPTRTWLQQREQIEAAEARLEVLEAQNERLSARVAKLQTDEEVERIAREQYQLVKPGEEAFAILPAPGSQDGPVEIGGLEPAPPPADDAPWWRRAWRAVSDLL